MGQQPGRAQMQPEAPVRLSELVGVRGRVYHLPGVAGTVSLDHVKRHYWDDHPMINRRIVPIGPVVDLSDPAAVPDA